MKQEKGIKERVEEKENGTGRRKANEEKIYIVKRGRTEKRERRE